jgi:alpha-beta hydrolase superfamily lysophospholipase
MRLGVAAMLATALAVLSPGQTSRASTTSCAGRGDVHFTASDKTRLVGHTFGKGTTVVVLAHQARSSMCQWVRYARRLSSNGYRAFAFDFRNHGLSQQVGYPRSGRLAGDVAAAVKYVRAHGARKVFLVGASMGGTAVLVGGANVRPLVAGVVSLSGPSSFGGADAAPAVPRLRVPVLYVVSSDDAGGGFAQDARALFDATASTDKTLELVPGSAHGVSLVSSPGRARDLVERFLGSR